MFPERFSTNSENGGIFHSISLSPEDAETSEKRGEYELINRERRRRRKIRNYWSISGVLIFLILISAGVFAFFKFNEDLRNLKFWDLRNSGSLENENPERYKEEKEEENSLNYDKFPSDCGKVMPTNRIQNGDKTDLFEHPWMATLFKRKIGTDEDVFHCGGSIINRRTILTAAHCMIDKKIDELVLRLGKHGIFDSDLNAADCTSNVPIECADPPIVINQKDFDTVTYQSTNSTEYHDIALIKLHNPINFSKSVQPICLPFHGDEDLKKALIIGFGEKRRFRVSKTLLKGNVDIINHNDCAKLYEDRNDRITENHLCALGKKEIRKGGSVKNVTVDSCLGDSGSPLLSVHIPVTPSDIKFTQYGITARGSNYCGHNDTIPGIYTRVYSYLSWIVDNADS